jgi:hypothetical protein
MTAVDTFQFMFSVSAILLSGFSLINLPGIGVIGITGMVVFYAVEIMTHVDYG